jgi:PPOX class probable F420-dependent enzyme
MSSTKSLGVGGQLGSGSRTIATPAIAKPEELSSDAPASLTAAVRRYLGAPRHATLATRGSDGTPHASVIWYRLDGEAILVNSRQGRRWPRELQGDPRCALTVIHPDIDLELYVAIQAEAEVVATGAEALGDIQALARRYGGNPAKFEGQERISFLLRPTAVIVHGELEPVVAEGARA